MRTHGLTHEQIEAVLPHHDSVEKALDSLTRTLRAAIGATVGTLEIAIDAIKSGRYGTPTEEDTERMRNLENLLARLNRANN